MILRARVVVPVSGPPIENGAVIIDPPFIRAVGPWRDLAQAAQGRVQDLGEVALLPGLINAHCHLDYTDMAGEIAPSRSFTDWIKCITTLKAGWSFSEFAQSWLRGARMLLRTGTTTVADVEAVPELLPEVWNATPLRVVSFFEMTGVRTRRNPRLILREATDRIQALHAGRGGCGLSPHAPYSTPPQLLALTGAIARERKWPVTTHVTESAEEFEMFVHRRGPMFDWIARNERDMSDCGLGTPIEHLNRNGLLGPNLLAVHANYLGPNDAEVLARSQTNVVHCPRSHFYFEHREFPFRELSAAGVNVCLGTDSLVTARRPRGRPLELNLFTEMAGFAKRFPQVAPEAILRLATVNGAHALGRSGQLGELSQGALADLIAIPFNGRLNDVSEATVDFVGEVAGSMIDGQWAIAPGAENP